MRLPLRSSSSLPSSSSRGGFTLVETLTILTVLAVLVGTVFYGLTVGRERAERTALASDISLLAQAQESYYGAAGSYAPTLEVLGFDPTLRTRVLGMIALPHRMVALAERDGTPALCGVLLSRQAADQSPQKVVCADGDPLGSPVIAQMGGIVEFDASTLLLTLTNHPSWGPTPAWAAVDVEFVGWSFGDGQGRIGTPDEAMRVTHAYQGDPTGRDVRVALWLRDGRMLQGGTTLAAVGDPDKKGVPQAAFTVSPAGDLRVGMEITLNGGASMDPDGRITAYQWTVDGTPLTGAVTRLRLEQAGTLPVRLVVTDNEGQQGTSERMLAVAPVADTAGTPTAQWTGNPLPAIAGRPVTFDAGVSTDPSGRIVRYVWTFSGGDPRATGATVSPGTSPGMSPGAGGQELKLEGRRVSVLWPVQGTSTVTLTVVSSTGQQHTSRSAVPILPATTPPSLEILPGHAVVRAGQPLSFTTAMTGTQTGAIDWNMGDGTVLSGAAVSHRFLVPGTYTVRAVASAGAAGAGAGTATVQVLNNLLPNAAFRVEPDPPTIGIPIVFDGTGSTDPDGEIVLHRWLWSDGLYQVGPIAERTFATAGTFMVSLTVQDDGRGQHTISVPVTVNSTPIASFTSPDPLQAGQPMPFDASASQDPGGAPIIAYIWVWPDGSVDSATTPTISRTFPAGTGPSATITLRVRTATDVGSITRTLTLNRPPVAQFTPTPLRVGITSDITLDNTSTDPDGDAMTARWTLPGGAELTDWSPTYRFPSEGSQSVTLTVQDGRGGEASVTRGDVVVVGAPIARITPPPGGLIAGANVTLSGEGSAADTTNGGTIVRYLWTLDGVTDSSTTPTIPFAVPAAGDVTITLRVRDDLGQVSAPDILALTPRTPNPPTAVLLLSDGVAPNVPILGDARDSYADSAAGSSLVMYRWNLGDGRTAEGAAPTLSMQWGTPGDYVVTLVVVDDAGRVSAPDSVTVSVSNALRAQFTVDPTSGPGGTTFTLRSTTTHPTGLPLSYRWLMNGASLGANTAVATARPGARGSYDLRLIVWDAVGGVDTSATQTITVAGRAPEVSLLGGPAVRSRLESSAFGLSVTPTDGDPVVATGWQALWQGDWITITLGNSTIGGVNATTTINSILLEGGVVGQFLTIRGWAEDADGVNHSAPVTIEIVNRAPVCGPITTVDEGTVPGSIVQVPNAALAVSCTDPENDEPLDYTWSSPASGTASGEAVWNTNFEPLNSVIAVSVTVRDTLGAETTVTRSFLIMAALGAPPVGCSHSPASDYILPSTNGVWISTAGCFDGGRQSAGRHLGAWAQAPLQGQPIGAVIANPFDQSVTLEHPAAPGTYYLYGTFVSGTAPLVTTADDSAPVCVLGPPTDGQIDGALSTHHWYGGKRYMTMVASWTSAPCGANVELLTGPSLDPNSPSWEVHATQAHGTTTGEWSMIQVWPFVDGGTGYDGLTRAVAIGVRTVGGGVHSAIMPLDMTTDYDDENNPPPVGTTALHLEVSRPCPLVPNENCLMDIRNNSVLIGAFVPITLWGSVPGASNLTMEWTDVTGGYERHLTNGAGMSWNCQGDTGVNEIRVRARYTQMPDGSNEQTAIIAVNCTP